MNTQVERLASRRNTRVLGVTYLDRISAWAQLKYKAYRARRAAIEAQEALLSMSPELLDDIDVKIDEFGKPMLELADQNPHVVAVAALIQSPRYHDPF
jgi:hypothetical protein